MVSALLMVAFLVATLANVLTIVRYARTRKRGSLVPLFGGIAGALAMILAPISAGWHWAWLPLVVDPGCVPTAIFAIVRRARRERGPRSASGR